MAAIPAGKLSGLRSGKTRTGDPGRYSMHQQLLEATTEGGTDSPKCRDENVNPAGLDFLDRSRGQVGQLRQALLREIGCLPLFPDIAPNRL